MSKSQKQKYTNFAATPGIKTHYLQCGLSLRRRAGRESFLNFTMKKKLLIARFYVAVQFICLAYLLYSGPWFATNYWLLALEVFGVLLGVVAIWQMGIGNVNITPIPKENGVLVTSGVYSLIRHPMYLAQLLVVAALVAEYYSPDRLAVLMLLSVNLVFKLHFEESRLLMHFDGYAAYRKKSWRLIPLVY